MADEKEKKYPSRSRISTRKTGRGGRRLKRHELYIQNCRDCGFMPLLSARAVHELPVLATPNGCDARGAGKIYTFTVTNQNQAPGFANRCPM